MFAENFVSALKNHANVWAWEIFEDVRLGAYIEGGKYYNGYWNTSSGRNSFRQWTYNKYNGNLSEMNSELQLWFGNWDDVENVAVYPNQGIIGCGDPWRMEFIEFSAVNFGYGVTEIASTIRNIDAEHMITGSAGDELYVSGVPIDKFSDWGLDFPSLKSYAVNGKNLFLATAAADINNKPVLISEWGIQTAYLDQVQYAEDEKAKADLVSSQVLLFASNPRVMGYCYFSLYDSKNMRAPDFGIIDVYGNPKESYYTLKERNALILKLAKDLAVRSWESKIGIILTSDAIYPPIPWDQEFINLYDELYRMGVQPSVVGEPELGKSAEYLAAEYDTLFAISRIYSFGSFTEENFARLEEFVERFPGNALVVLPITGMYGRNAQLQPNCEFHSRKLSGYSSGSEGPSNIWNIWGNDGNTYEFSICGEESDLYDKEFSGVAKWHWYDYTAGKSAETLVNNEKGYVSLTVHALGSGSKVITLFPDAYVNELPPSISDAQGPRSAQVFTHLTLEYLGIPNNPEMEVVSFEVGDYRLASYFPHLPKYDTAVWGAEDPRPVFDDVAGTFKDNSSFIARISVSEDEIITETSAPATFEIKIPRTWGKSRSGLHVLDAEDNQIAYRIVGNKIRFEVKEQGIYRFMHYEFISVGVWVTRGVYALIIMFLIAMGIKRFRVSGKQKIDKAFDLIGETYPLKAYAIITPGGKTSKSDNWMPEPAEMNKLFNENSNVVMLHGFDYDIMSRDLERGIAAARKENMGTIVGVKMDEKILVTWSSDWAEVNDAIKGLVTFANSVLK